MFKELQILEWHPDPRAFRATVAGSEWEGSGLCTRALVWLAGSWGTPGLKMALLNSSLKEGVQLLLQGVPWPRREKQILWGEGSVRSVRWGDTDPHREPRNKE